MPIPKDVTARHFPQKSTSWICVGLLLVVAFGVRLLCLNAEPLWGDEALSILGATVQGYPTTPPATPWTVQEWIARQWQWQPLQWSALMGMLRQNVHMPLYYILLNPWLGLWGMNEWALRSFSAVCSVGSVAALFGLGKALQTLWWAETGMSANSAEPDEPTAQQEHGISSLDISMAGAPPSPQSERRPALHPEDYDLLADSAEDSPALAPSLQTAHPTLSAAEAYLNDPVEQWLKRQGAYWSKAFKDSLLREPLAWAMALLATFSPFQLYYAQEGRMYALGLLWTVLATLAFWKLLFVVEYAPHEAPGGAGTGRPHWPSMPSLQAHSRWAIQWTVVYAVALLAGMFTHYTFVLVIGFHGVFWLLSVLLGRWKLRLPSAYFNAGYSFAYRSPIGAMLSRQWMGMGIGWALVAMALAAWFPVYQEQMTFMAVQDHFSEGLMSPLRYVGALFWNFFLSVAGNNPYSRMGCALVFALGGLGYAVQVYRKRIQPFWALEGFALAWGVIPLLAAIVLDVVKQTHFTTVLRYTMWIAPGAIALLALVWVRWLWSVRFPATETPEDTRTDNLPRSSVSIFPGWVPVVLTTTACLLVILGVGTVWMPSPLRFSEKSDMNELGAYLAEHAQPGDLLIMNGVWGITPMAVHYLHREAETLNSGRGPLPEAWSVNQLPVLHWSKRHGLVRDIALPPVAMLRQYRRVWLVRHRSNKVRGSDEIQDYLQGIFPNKQLVSDAGEKLWRFEPKALTP